MNTNTLQKPEKIRQNNENSFSVYCGAIVDGRCDEYGGRRAVSGGWGSDGGGWDVGGSGLREVSGDSTLGF